MIGIISDTHGLVRPEVVYVFKDCTLILHAGDVGKPEVLKQLQDIAPVVAVRGNVDRGIWAEKLPFTEVVNLKRINIYILHNVNDLDLDPKAAGFHVVISGHSHKPKKKWQDDVLFLNPGSAGPKRFSLPVCVATLETDHDKINVRYINLSVRN